ncbi:MAG: ABC transporter transmembrane domain-containing protein [Pseudomonadota bacterium]
MEPSLFKYIWRYTKAQQIWILTIILISMVPYFLALDLPKRIVNGPIQGEGFEGEGATQPFMEISFGVPSWISDAGTITLFNGFDLGQLSYLFCLCATFLAFVCINGLFKYYINTFKGRLGERMLRRLRYQLLDRILRFPNAYFRRIKAPEAATMIKDEVEPLGGFIGDMLVQPVFLGGQALTAMTFILVQDVYLGLIAGSIVGVQAFLIPRLRRRLLVLGKQRQLTARALAGRVGEVVDGINNVHTNDTSNWERADLASRLGRIFAIRYELFQRKFFIKFLNNFLAQMTPFMFYLVGGYLAITGKLDIGQLVAVIAAYKDLPGPVADLISYDQQRLDVQIKYGQVIEQFQPENMMDPELQDVPKTPVGPIREGFSASRVGVIDEAGTKLLESATFKLSSSEQVAAIGTVNAGAETMADVLARITVPTSGSINLDDRALDEHHEAFTGRRTAYVGPDVYLPQTSFRDALVYGLRHEPVRDREPENADPKQRAWEVFEANQAGNTTLDIHDDWLDYEALGISERSAVDEVARDYLDIVDLKQDVFDLGLRGTVDPEEEPELAAKFLEARAALRHRLEDPSLSKLVEVFEPNSYSLQASVGENLLFGTATGPTFERDKLVSNAYVRDVLANGGLSEAFFDMGRKIAATATELFKDLPPDHPFFERLSFMDSEEIPEYEAALGRSSSQTLADASDADKDMFLRLPFDYVEPQHRFGLLDDEMKQRILEARRSFREGLPEAHSDAISFYDPETFNPAASLLDNILLGRVAYGVAEGPEKVKQVINDVLDELDLKDEVFQVGLNFNVGNGGKRLNVSQRQKLALARALIKRPDVLIVNRGLSALDSRTQQTLIERVLTRAKGENGERSFGVFWVLQAPRFAENFSRVLVFDKGSLVEDGTPSDLAGQDGQYAKLVAGA